MAVSTCCCGGGGGGVVAVLVVVAILCAIFIYSSGTKKWSKFETFAAFQD